MYMRAVNSIGVMRCYQCKPMEWCVVRKMYNVLKSRRWSGIRGSRINNNFVRDGPRKIPQVSGMPR
jgi:hypothetical protein